MRIHHGLIYGNPTSENKPDYTVGRGKPPVHTPFEKGQSGNRRGPRPKNLPALLIEALDEPVTATIDGESCEITKREAVVTKLLNRSAAADLHATKMLVDMLKDAEKKAGDRTPARARPFHPTEEEVTAFIAKMRRSWEEELRWRHRLEGALWHRGSCLHRCGKPERPGDRDPSVTRPLSSARIG